MGKIKEAHEHATSLADADKGRQEPNNVPTQGCKISASQTESAKVGKPSNEWSRSNTGFSAIQSVQFC